MRPGFVAQFERPQSRDSSSWPPSSPQVPAAFFDCPRLSLVGYWLAGAIKQEVECVCGEKMGLFPPLILHDPLL